MRGADLLRRVAPLLPALAGPLLVFRPWRWEPFAAEDFSEFLPLLSTSLGESFRRLLAYYTSQGRWNPVSQLYVAVNWALFGEHSVAWNLGRAILLLVELALLFAVLRRLRISPAPAVAATMLFGLSSAAAGSWTRLTAEPLVVLALLVGALLAIGYRSAERWGTRAAGLGAAAAVAVLSKEVAVAAVPFLALLAVARDDRRARGAETSVPPGRLDGPRFVWLVVVLAAVVAAAAVPVIHAVRGAPPDAYVTAYGPARPAFRVWLELLVSHAVPFHVIAGGPIGVLLLNELFAVLVCAAWWRRCRRTGGDSRCRTLLPLFLFLPVGGALVYWPWPRFENFYALPFFLGGTLLFAFAVEELRSAGGLARRLCWIGVTLLLLGGAAGGWNLSNRTNALRRTEWTAARLLPRLELGGGIVMGVPGEPERAWQGPGATLRRFAESVAPGPVALPPAEDLPCAGVRSLAADPARRRSVLSYAHLCGPLHRPAARIVRHYRRLGWSWPLVAADSIVLEWKLPAGSESPDTGGS
ncbi:MAG: hypothetical protein ACE5HP_02505 [Gemmatimonadota bacterium]